MSHGFRVSIWLREKQVLHFILVYHLSTPPFSVMICPFKVMFSLMGKNDWSVMIRLPKHLQVRSCILDTGPIQLWAVSTELKLVLACWELTVSCWERKTNFGNDMWYLDYLFLQFIILSIFFNQKVSRGAGRLVSSHILWLYFTAELSQYLRSNLEQDGV